MATREQKYHQAAITYLIYGLIYLSGAIYLSVIDMVARSGWAWFFIGAIFLLVLPPLIWKKFKWVTRILAVLVFVRVAGLARLIITDKGETVPLPGGTSLPMVYGAAAFLIVAALTGGMLVRAGWSGAQEGVARAGSE